MNRRNTALGVIFSVFVGLMVTAFFVIGVMTFHPFTDAFDRRLQELDQRQQAITLGRIASEWTDEQRAELAAISEERQNIWQERDKAARVWGRNTSIVLITLATLTMVVSLIPVASQPVISNGLLLGGVFTMLYGTGWIVTTDASLVRFVVIAIALAITLALGYVRFVQRRPSVEVTETIATGTPEGLIEIERRLTDLERRIKQVANVLGEQRAVDEHSHD